MIETLAAAVAVALVAPYLLPQIGLAPTSAIAMWLSVLALRAALALTLGAILVLLVPATPTFHLLTSWCIHAVVPFIAAHLGLEGHRLADTAVLLPVAAMLASLLSAAFGLWRATRALGRWIRRGSLGVGPKGSVIVGGSSVVVAAAGVRPPRVVVSTGALLCLDDEELAAGLEHEWGHVNRRHALLGFAGRLLHSVSCLLPGGRRAFENLRFHLECDADDFAVRRTGNPLALASAICKASVDMGGPMSPALANLGGAEARASERLRALLAGAQQQSRRGSTTLARLIAVAAAALTLVLAASVPAIAADGIARHAGAESGLDCPD